MNKMIAWILVVVFAVLASATSAQAQSRPQSYPGDYGRYSGGAYNGRTEVRCNYDRYGRPYNCRRIEIRRGGSVGPFIAGAVVGGVVGAVVASRRNNQQSAPMAQPVSQAPYPYEGQQESVAVQPQPVAGPAANGGEGQFELSNSTRVYVEAYDGDKYIGRLSPVGMQGSTLRVGPPKDRYKGFALIPQPDGRLANDELGREVSPSGWSFIEPSVARQGGQ